jgi:DNA repair photolyase
MSLITVFDPWKSKICTCPQKYSLSPYTGCGHRCLYCYASSYIRNFHCPRPKKDLLKRLEKEIKKIPENSLITISNSSDPYMPEEKEWKLTRDTLKILKNYDLRIMLVTKSSLILRDLDILKEFNKLVVCVTLTTLKDNLTKKLEAFASSPKERLKAIEELSRRLPVVCRFDPLIYPLNTNEINDVVKAVKTSGAKQIITSTYKAKPDNFKRMVNAFPEHKKIWNKLYILEGKRLGQYIYLPKKLRKELIDKVREACLKENLYFSTCREGLSHLNTKNCDGSSFF